MENILCYESDNDDDEHQDAPAMVHSTDAVDKQGSRGNVSKSMYAEESTEINYEKPEVSSIIKSKDRDDYNISYHITHKNRELSQQLNVKHDIQPKSCKETAFGLDPTDVRYDTSTSLSANTGNDNKHELHSTTLAISELPTVKMSIAASRFTEVKSKTEENVDLLSENEMLTACKPELSFKKLNCDSFANISVSETPDCSSKLIDREVGENANLQPFEQMQSAVDSDSDCSDSSSSSNEDSLAINANIEVDDFQEKKPTDVTIHETMGPLVPGELTMYDLPPIADLTIDIGKEVELSELGSVISIVDCLVIVKANQGTPALDEDTILFVQDRSTVGKVFETFGPVVSPYYSMRFNSVENVTNSKLSIGDKIYFAAREGKSLTNYVFVDRLKQIKGSDASWLKHHEPPEKFLDYSDDEQERKAKAKHRTRGRNTENDLEQSDGTAGDGLSKKKVRNQHTSNATGHSGSKFIGPSRRAPHGAPQSRPPIPQPNTPPVGGYGAWSNPPHHYPYHAQTNYPLQPWRPPAAFGAPPAFNSGWQNYNSSWTEKDNSFYAESTKPPPKFVDTRFVQHNDFSSNKGN